MSTTTQPKLNPQTAFLQMQRARKINTAIAEELAKPKTYTSESPDFKVEAPKPTIAATGEPVDVDKLIGIDPALDVHDLDDVTLAKIMVDDAELTALSGKIDEDGTWSDETVSDGSWMMTRADVELDPHFGRGARLRTFVNIDPLDPHDAIDAAERTWGYHTVAA